MEARKKIIATRSKTNVVTANPNQRLREKLKSTAENKAIDPTRRKDFLLEKMRSDTNKIKPKTK